MRYVCVFALSFPLGGSPCRAGGGSEVAVRVVEGRCALVPAEGATVPAGWLVALHVPGRLRGCCAGARGRGQLRAGRPALVRTDVDFLSWPAGWGGGTELASL